MAYYVMRCLGLATAGGAADLVLKQLQGKLDVGPPLYLASYDVEARGGLGECKWTAEIGEALRFADMGALMETWKASPKVHPIRLSDGKPNRPLTAFSIEPVRVEE